MSRYVLVEPEPPIAFICASESFAKLVMGIAYGYP